MLIRADARAIPLRDGCVQTCVTSPPYFRLRDYDGAANQIGVELTPALYIASLVAAFAEVHRVLRDSGTAWCVIGDCFANDGKWGGETGGKQSYLGDIDRRRDGRSKVVTGLKDKDLIGIPWMLAFALRDDGWWLRQDVIWHKPNALCESVKDRPTTTHEHVFLLAKSKMYYFDGEAIKEPALDTGRVNGRNGREEEAGARPPKSSPRTLKRLDYTLVGRNKRSVWTVPTQPTPLAHFATFPEALVEPCILAGSRPGDIVLDPFAGTCTTGAVAERFGRRWVGIDLSYQDLAQTRTAQRGLRFSEAPA